MNNEESHSKPHPTSGGKLWLVAVGVLVLLLGMVASIYYPYPGGKSLGLGNFLLLWFRELLILLVVVVVVLIGAISKMRKSLRAKTASGDHAP